MNEVRYIRIPPEISQHDYDLILRHVGRIERNARIFRRYLELRGSDYDTNVFLDISVEFNLSDIQVRHIVRSIMGKEVPRTPTERSAVLNFVFSD